MIPARIWASIEKTETCWLWHGARTQGGYGLVTVGLVEDNTRRTVLIHRLFYEEFIGPIPEGLHLDHLCRVRNCCHPDHVEAVTQAENNRRATPRKRKKQCQHGWFGKSWCPACKRTYHRRYNRKRRKKVPWE